MIRASDYRTPGQLIEELLASKGWTQRVLAIILRMDETGINKLVAAKRPVDAPMAIVLGDIFGVPPEIFLEIQRGYDLAQARLIMRPDPARANRALLFGDLPITEMIRRRWLDAKDVRDVPGVEASLIKFFGVASLDEIEILPHAAKKTNASTPTTPAQLAWLYRVREIAADVMVGRYSPVAVSEVIAKLKPLL